MINVKFFNINNRISPRYINPPRYFINIILIFVCLTVFLKLYDGYNNDFRPQGIHFWAQADRSSIAINYYDNGLIFFTPQTNYLELSNGKTGVEFPIIQYIAAVSAKILGVRDKIFLIYRVNTFLILVSGILFLSKTVKLHGANGFQQVLIPVFYLLSPVLLFYGFNLIPDVPAFSLILISFYFFEKYRLKLGFNNIYLAFAWSSAASLLKLTSAVFPVAYLCWFVIDSVFIEKQITRKQIFKAFGAFSVFFGLSILINYFFTVNANARFGSTVFLSSSRHINKITDFNDIWENVVCWHREYFSEPQYWIILAAFVASFYTPFLQKGYLVLKSILLIGFICFILLMGKQLMHHDYYAICTIIPIVLIFSIDGLMYLTKGCFGSLILLYFVNNIYNSNIIQSFKRQAEVYNIPCREIWDYRQYMLEADEWFKANNINKNAKVFVLYDYPLNTPLVYIDRKGMVLDHYKMKDKNLVNYWFKLHKPVYLVIPIQWKTFLKNDNPQIYNKTSVIFEGKNVLISIMDY